MLFEQACMFFNYSRCVSQWAYLVILELQGDCDDLLQNLFKIKDLIIIDLRLKIYLRLKMRNNIWIFEGPPPLFRVENMIKNEVLFVVDSTEESIVPDKIFLTLVT